MDHAVEIVWSFFVSYIWNFSESLKASSPIH